MPTVETIFSPALIKYHSLENKSAVIIDVLRATTSICYAFHQGARSMTPVSTPDDCLRYRTLGHLCAGERNGVKLDGFDMGNSPDEFRAEIVKDRDIAITTTNGTYALFEAKDASRIYIGSFLNLSALGQHLREEQHDVALICAGWKNKVNLEDSLFAGALASLLDGFESDCDSTLMARSLWEGAKDRLHSFVEQSSHARRFSRLGIDDLPVCLDTDRCPVIPEYTEEQIVLNRGESSLFD